MKINLNIITSMVLLATSSVCCGAVRKGEIYPNIGVISIPAGSFGFQTFTYKPGTYDDSKGNEIAEADAVSSDWNVAATFIKGLFTANPKGNSCTVSADSTKITHSSSKDVGTVSCKASSANIIAR